MKSTLILFSLLFNIPLFASDCNEQTLKDATNMFIFFKLKMILEYHPTVDRNKKPLVISPAVCKDEVTFRGILNDIESKRELIKQAKIKLAKNPKDTICTDILNEVDKPPFVSSQAYLTDKFREFMSGYPTPLECNYKWEEMEKMRKDIPDVISPGSDDKLCESTIALINAINDFYSGCEK